MIEVANVHHINIDVEDVHRSVKFYEDVLGLKDGPAPTSSRPLHWVYAGDMPIIHISQSGEDKAKGPPLAEIFQHIALRITNFDDALARVEELGIEHRTNVMEEFPVRQIFFDDPDGVTIELIETGGPA
ncbi:MAG: VOC family protein [Rhodospirillales bacterium]|nr:VOC family protein [Rhodospirillales bacterium]